jgi:geranylgeranyl pyrophosphate synthase
MVERLLVEKVWSDAGVVPSYAAEMQRVFQEACEPAASKATAVANLPVLFCEAKGGCRAQSVPLATAWSLLRYAARLLDDVEDGDAPGSGSTINVSTGLIFTACGALAELVRCGVDPLTAGEINQRFYKTVLQVCSGQHLDLTLPASSLEVAWQMVEAKTGSFVGLICWAGARLATDDPQFLNSCYRFGCNLGVLDQVRDDLCDLWDGQRQVSDLKHSCLKGLPVAYALSVLPADGRQRLRTCLEAAAFDRQAEKEARQIIIESGAGVYLAVQSNLTYEKSAELLARMDLPVTTQKTLMHLLDSLRPLK